MAVVARRTILVNHHRERCARLKRINLDSIYCRSVARFQRVLAGGKIELLVALHQAQIAELQRRSTFQRNKCYFIGPVAGDLTGRDRKSVV